MKGKLYALLQRFKKNCGRINRVVTVKDGRMPYDGLNLANQNSRKFRVLFFWPEVGGKLLHISLVF